MPSLYHHKGGFAMANKFKKEKYISQQQTKQGWKFRVRIYINKILIADKTFHEKDHLNVKEAFNAAKQFRDQTLATGEVTRFTKKATVEDCYNMSFDLYPLRKETVRKTNLLFNKYVPYHLVQITDITAADIQRSLNELIEIASDDTIKRVFTIWKRIFKTALINDYCNKDITIKVIAPKSHFKPQERCFTTNKQTLDLITNLLLEQKRANKFDNKMICYALEIMFYTGLRPCECFALNKEDINMLKRELSINKELGSTLSESNVIRPCKTDKSNRKVPICDDLYDVLFELINMQPSKKLLADHTGNYFNTTKVGNKLRLICRKNDIKFNMYQLRHQFSTDLITNHVDVRTVMELMGHNNTNMTVEYARSSDDLKAEALKNRKLS